MKVKIREMEDGRYLSIEKLMLILYDDLSEVHSVDIKMYIEDLISRIKRLNNDKPI